MENKEGLTKEDKNLIEEDDESLDDLKDLYCCNCDPKDCDNCRNEERCGFVPFIFGPPMELPVFIVIIVVAITIVVKSILF